MRWFILHYLVGFGLGLRRLTRSDLVQHGTDPSTVRELISGDMQLMQGSDTGSRFVKR
jgi:hypothetical protein